tara:strand:+ start:819 stop:1736 length:918 start_codon:yes stop_codon:yes gene_type:complete
MTYVGAVPTTGDFKLLDSITTSSSNTFNLRQGGVAVYPQSANHCIVQLNGVNQVPGSSFNIVNDTIVFASSLSSDDVINQILVLGNVNDIGVPSDDTISTAKIQTDAVTQAKIADEAIDEARMQISNAGSNGQFLSKQSGNTGGLTWASAGGDNTPSFMSYMSSVQAISNSTRTILAFNNDSGTTGGITAYDTDNAFDTSTYKFTPQTAGYYFAFMYCGLQDLNSGNNYTLNLCKNGSSDGDKFSQFSIRQNGTNNIYGNTQGITYLNGSSDFLCAVLLHNHGSNRNTADTYNTGFGAWKLNGVS